MGKLHKAQVNALDLLFAILIFLTIMSLYEFTWNAAVQTASPSEAEFSLRAYHIANTLFESGGYPSSWTPDNVRVIGLCTERNVVDKNKLVNFIDLMNTNYPKAKELLGLGASDIYMNVTDPQNNIIYLDGRAGSMGLPPTGALLAAHTSSVMKISAVMRANNSLAIIFDQSGSMGDMLPEGRTKIDAAKLAFSNFLTKVLLSDEVGVTTFRNCDSRYTAQPFTTDMNAVRSAVNGMSASGTTPIEQATRYTADFINTSAHNTNRVLIVFSDGEETCSGSPTSGAQYAMTRGVNTLNTIGFTLAPNTTGAQQLQQMAVIGHGRYYSANNSAELEQALLLAYQSSEKQVVINIVVWQ